MTNADDIQHHSLNNHCWKSKTHQNRNGSTFTYPLHTQTHTNTNTLCFFKFSSNLLKLSKPKTQPWKDIPWSLQQASCVFWHSSTYHDYNNSLVMMMMNSFCGMVDWRKAFSLVSSWDHCQRSSPLQIYDKLWASLQPAQNLSSGLVEWRRVQQW